MSKKKLKAEIGKLRKQNAGLEKAIEIWVGFTADLLGPIRAKEIADMMLRHIEAKAEDKEGGL